MTAPRIISAAEAEALYRHGTDEELAAAAPDLAASVVALHDERTRIVGILEEMIDQGYGDVDSVPAVLRKVLERINKVTDP